MGDKIDNNLEVVIYTADPFGRLNPFIVNALIAFEEVKVYRDFYIYISTVFSADYSEIAYDNDGLFDQLSITSNPSFTSDHPELFPHSMHNSRRKVIKIPPFRNLWEISAEDLNTLLSSKMINSSIFSCHDAVREEREYRKAFGSFINKWIESDFDENKITKNDYQAILLASREGMLTNSIEYSIDKSLPLVSDNGNLLNLPKISPQSVASVLANETMKLVFPKVKTLDFDDLYELRHRLRNYLPEYWRQMKIYAWEVKKIIGQGADAKTIQEEAEFLIGALVKPSLEQLQDKMTDRSNNFFRKVLGATLDVISFSIDFGTSSLANTLLKMSAKVGQHALELEKFKLDSKKLVTFLYQIEKEADAIRRRKRII